MMSVRPCLIANSAAVQRDHPAVAFVDHVIGFGDAVIGAQRVKREPHVAAGVLHQLAHDGQIPFIRADDHAAAEEIEDRTLGRRWMFSDDQARKAVHRDRFIMRLAVGGRKYAAIAVLLVNDLPNFLIRQPKRLFRAGKLVSCAQNRSEDTHTVNSFPVIVSTPHC